METWSKELVYEAKEIELHEGIANNAVSFFNMGDKCYIMDGTNYLVYDGVTVSEVVPYIPHLTISGKPGLFATGSLLEDVNLLGAGFKETYSGDGVGVDFALALKPIDATPVIVTMDNVVQTLTTHYTVNATTGIITFVTAPTVGTNNVEITAYKTNSGFADRIKQCAFSVKFGGSSDTRMFLSGNPNMPEYVWRLGLNDPTYAPENGFYTFSDKVMGFAKQYDYLVVERENGKHQITFDLSSGEASFPSKPINDQVGTIAPNSIQIIENNPVSLSKNGVFMLTQSNVRDERNVQHISANVDSKLLIEPNLNKSVSVDYQRKYWLAVNGNVYVFDYSISEWYVYNNINASGFIEINGELYFSSATEGLIYRFYKESEGSPFNDDGLAIESLWKSKQLVFGADELRKLVERVYFSLKPMTRTSADLYYISNKKESELVKTSRMDLMDLRDIDFSNWSFILSQFPQESMAKIKAKKITHFQLIIKNEKLDEGLGLLSVGIKYRYQSPVK